MRECEKIPFYSAEEAREELERIVATNYKPWKSKKKVPYGGHKPSRYYKCPFCSTEEQGVWHLTSSIKIKEY